MNEDVFPIEEGHIPLPCSVLGLVKLDHIPTDQEVKKYKNMPETTT